MLKYQLLIIILNPKLGSIVLSSNFLTNHLPYENKGTQVTTPGTLLLITQTIKTEFTIQFSYC